MMVRRIIGVWQWNPTTCLRNAWLTSIDGSEPDPKTLWWSSVTAGSFADCRAGI